SGFSIQFNSDGVLGLEDNDFTSIEVFPNPVSSVLHISNVENTTIEIYTILGQVMFTKENTFNQETIDVSSYKSGTYFIKISNGAFTTTKKFTVI
ncbi:MAG: T9SS type A sorting domain-containing protein, partial [Flavobacteriaceae bacterium]